MQRTNLNVSFGKDEVSLYNEMVRVASLTYTPVAQLTRKYLREGLKNDPVANKFKSYPTMNQKNMTLTYTNSKTEARVLKAVKALTLTQTKAPTKEQFMDEALNYYIDELIKKKMIKMQYTVATAYPTKLHYWQCIQYMFIL